MTTEIKHIPCGVDRCKWKFDYDELQPRYEELKANYDKLKIEQETFARVIEENQEVSNPEVKEIIKEKVNLYTEKAVLETENKNYKSENESLKVEVKALRESLQKKTQEVIEIKSSYELDEEIVEKHAELDKVSKELGKKILERNRFNQLIEKLKLKLRDIEKEYNDFATRINETMDKLKQTNNEIRGKKLELGRLDKVVNQARKQSRLAKMFVKKRKKNENNK